MKEIVVLNLQRWYSLLYYLQCLLLAKLEETLGATYKSAEKYVEWDKPQQLKSKWENDLFKQFGNFKDIPCIVLFDVNPHDGKWPTAFVRSFQNLPPLSFQINFSLSSA
jgi:hypothetical protein